MASIVNLGELDFSTIHETWLNEQPLQNGWQFFFSKYFRTNTYVWMEANFLMQKFPNQYFVDSNKFVFLD